MMVKGLRKVLTKALADLKKMPENIEVFHVLCPDGCYSGDMESTFHSIEVRHEKAEDGSQGVVLYLSY